MDTTRTGRLSATVVMVPPDVLVPHPDRQKAGTTLSTDDGKYQFIRETIEQHGIEDAIKVQRGTNIILGGHTRHRIATELGLSQVPVTYYDVDDETARYMMVVDNHQRIGDEPDPMKLAWTFKVVVDERKRPSEGNSIMGETVSPGGTHKMESEWPGMSTIASFFGMKRTHFYRYLKLLHLIPALQQFVSEQKIAVKAGAILAQLSPGNQQKVVDSITPEVFRPEYRLTETDARNFADVFKSGEVEASDTDGIGDDWMTFFGQPSVEVFDVSANQQPLELFAEDGHSAETQQVEPSSLEDQEAGRNIGDELQRADEMLEKPQHHKYLAEAQKVDETHAVSPDEATHLYNAARDVTRMVMRMDDEEAQAKFARNQLEASVRRQLTTIRKIDLELVPLRVLVGDRLDGEGSELWQELVQQLTRIAKKIQAVSGV